MSMYENLPNMYVIYLLFELSVSFVAISQRHHSVYFEHILNQREDIVTDIKTFFYHIISPKFDSSNCEYITFICIFFNTCMYVYNFNVHV